jgi:NADH-quinone oxidoreductase subunit G
LFTATVHATKLDEIATRANYATPQDVARLGFAVAHFLDNACKAPNEVSAKEQELAKAIADALSAAQRPIIISGTSCGSPEVIQAAANIAWVLNKKNKNAGIVLTLPECNSLGLALMKGKKLESAFEAVRNDKANTVFILENDLYRIGKEEKVNEFLRSTNVVVLDHTHHATAKKATLTIPAGTFAESDGVIVSNEGRAQRFFQVYEATDVIQESWRWLINIGKACGNKTLSQWQNFDDITNAIALEETLLKNIDRVAPTIDNRINGQRVPREPHRYSGRTAMLANINVSEPKPHEDPDSSLSYTMEGYSGMPPSTMIPFFWSPGWNSIQAINKYQKEVGKALRGGDPGIRLFEPSTNGNAKYFNTVPEKFIPSPSQLLVVPLHHIFGSEQLSSHAAGVAKRIPEPYVVLCEEDASALKVEAGQSFSFEIDGQAYQLHVRISKGLPKGTLGLPYGLSKLPFVQLPAIAKIKGKES